MAVATGYLGRGGWIKWMNRVVTARHSCLMLKVSGQLLSKAFEDFETPPSIPERAPPINPLASIRSNEEREEI